MQPQWLIMVVAGAVAIMGAIFLSYNLYQLVAIDAEARGMKRPRLWAFFSLPTGNGGALPIYLIARRKYTRKKFEPQEQKNYDAYKKKSKLSLAIFLFGIIPLIVTAIYYFGID